MGQMLALPFLQRKHTTGLCLYKETIESNCPAFYGNGPFSVECGGELFYSFLGKESEGEREKAEQQQLKHRQPQASVPGQ